MPVIEITQLRLKVLTFDDPALLKGLSLVRSKLQTNSRFFSCIEDTNLIYIFGVWSSLDAHQTFLASPTRDEILGPQEEILDFQWTIHLELDVTSPLLLDAPFIAIERLDVNADQVDAYDKVIQEHVRSLQNSGLSEATYGWRCDMPAGSYEAVVVSSSSSEGPRVTLAGRHIALSGDDRSAQDFRETQLHRAWNLERTHSAK